MSRKKKKKRGRSETEGKKQAAPPKQDSILLTADNLLFSGVLLILFLRPFISGRTYSQYNHFFHLAVCVVTILWILKRYRLGTLELHNRLITGFAGAFMLVCSITLFTTVDKGLTLRYIYEILSYTALLLIIANNFRDASSIKAAALTILSAALLTNAYGIYQRYHTLEQTRLHLEAVMKSGNQDLLPGIPLGTEILHRLQSMRVFSTFIYPNAYALFLVMVGALTIGFFWSMRAPMRELARGLLGRFLLLPLFAVSCALILWNLWLTYSRGGWLSAIAVALVILAVRFLRKGAAPAQKVAMMIFAATLLTALATPSEPLSADTIVVREESFIERLKDSNSVIQRISYWKASLEMAKDNPWLGVGWGAFEKAYPRYMILDGYPVKLAHNNYLQVWAETGIVGLNAFIGMWLVVLYTFWRKTRPGAAGELRGIACGVGAALVGFIVNSLVDFALYLPALMYYVYAFVGLLIATPTDSDEKDKFTIPFRALPATAAVAAVCVCAWFIFESYLSMSLLMRVEDERNKAFPTQFAVERGFKVDPNHQRRVLRESIGTLKRSIAYFPYSGETRHMLGDTYLRLSKMENAPYLLSDAIKQFERAAELSPLSPSIFQSLATAYWVVGRETKKPELFERALEAELRASENFPVNPEYHAKLRQIYLSLGMREKALEEEKLERELRKHWKKF